MILGLDITAQAIRLSVRGQNGYIDRVIGGFDLTRPEGLPVEKQQEFKEILQKTADQLLNGRKAEGALAAIPISCGHKDWIRIGMLLQAAGIPLLRSLNRGGAKGLYMLSCAPAEMRETICCMGKNGDWLELTYMDIFDGVLEVQEHYTGLQPELIPGFSGQVYLSDGLHGSEEVLREKNVSGGFCVLDDFAASRGAVIDGEIILNYNRNWLLMDLFREGICLEIDGKECLNLFDEPDSLGVTIPFLRYLEIPAEKIQNGKTLTINMKNLYTGEISVMDTISLAHIPQGSEYNLLIEIEVDRSIRFDLEVNRYPVHQVILPCRKEK